jgi:hypothetical protein
MVDYCGQDAIYLIDTSAEEGLPVVGHAIVYIQDSEGNWYMTDYSGSEKSAASIRFMSVSNEEVGQIVRGEAGGNIQYVYISGDFSQSVTEASRRAGTDFSGYNLIYNNCADYAQLILSKGSFDNQFDYLAVSGTGSPIPADLLRSIYEVRFMGFFLGGVDDVVEGLWKTLFK